MSEKKPTHLGKPVIDKCPFCAANVNPGDRQELVFIEKDDVWGRECGACLLNTTKGRSNTTGAA